MTVSATPLYAVGDIVVLPFPSSTGDVPKRRPAIILAAVVYGSGMDYIVCLVTSQAAPDPMRLTLTQDDIQNGILSVQSYLRPAYLYTASERLILRRIATLSSARLTEALSIVAELFMTPLP